MSIPARQATARTSPRLNKQVLIVTDDQSASARVVGHLNDLALDVSVTNYDGAQLYDLPTQAPAAVLCFLSDYIEHGPAIIADIRDHYAPRDFPILGRLMRQALGDHPYDSVLYEPVHAVQVAHRISSLIRLGQMETEIVRRMDTLKQTFGQDLKISEDGLRDPFRVLFIGRADPSYMAVANALKHRNVEITAAFTSFSAFDYLHDTRFEAVIINALQGSEPALTISATMRRNPRLFHVPTLLLVDKSTFKDEALAFDHGIKDLIDADSPAEELSGRVLELANEFRLHQKLKDEFTNLGGSACSDMETGVLNAQFLAAHLKRVSQDCRARKVPLTILTAKLAPQSNRALAGTDLRDAYASAIRMIAGVVRMQDIVARVDADTVIVAFPEEKRTDVSTIAARIVDLIENASFHVSGETGDALIMRVETAIVEQGEQSGENINIDGGTNAADTLSLVR